MSYSLNFYLKSLKIMNKSLISIWGICSFVLLFSSCDKSKENNDPCQSDFDQNAMFTNIADNIIIPDYKTLSTSLDEMTNKIQLLIEAPNESKLLDAQSSFRETYYNWQRVALYSFGPAESEMLRENFNYFPANTSQIDQRILDNDFEFNQIESYDKGLPAVDYLLYGIGGESNSQQLDFINQNQSSLELYFNEISFMMNESIQKVIQDWEVFYRDQFIENIGTAEGTSMSLLINNFNKQYELIKRDKIGIPAGIFTLNIPNPTKVEAYYSQISSHLALGALQACWDFYLGKDLQGNNGLGLDDFLKEINVLKNGHSLDDLIQSQFSESFASMSDHPIPLSSNIGEGQTNAQIESVYEELSNLVVLIKTDLPTALCISITYVDNPSDSD